MFGAMAANPTKPSLIGVMSDTHNRIAAATGAIDLLIARGVSRIVHCGDVGPDVIDQLAAAVHQGVPATMVYGNTDYDPDALHKAATAQGVQDLRHGGVLKVSGKRVAVSHGHLPNVWRELAPMAYALSGHSHVPHDYTENGVRFLNPGALFRTSRKTVGLLDVEADRWELLDVDV
jgi:putative phosphoesterase